MDKLEIALDKGYYIDEDGNAFSRFKQLKTYIKKHYPYYHFGIKVGNKTKLVAVHRLQAHQKFGKRLFKDGIEVRHLNNNKLDNSWDNIAHKFFHRNS